MVYRAFSQCIDTEYKGCTNTKPSKINAKWNGLRLSVSYDHSLSIQENHKSAAMKCIAKYQIDYDIEKLDLISAWNSHNGQSHIAIIKTN